MKKALFLGLAVLGCSLLAGTDIDVKGKFTNVKGQMPEGWIYNTSTKPTGTASAVQHEGKNAVKFDAVSSEVHIYFDQQIPAKPGDQFEVEADFVGNGKAGVGLYFYDAKGQWISGDFSARTAIDGKGEVKRIIDVPAGKDGRVPARVRIAVIAAKGAALTLTEVEVDKLN